MKIRIRKKVVFLYGSRSHASGDHEFQAGCHLLAKHLNAQKKVPINAVVNAGWPDDESILDDASAIVIYADGTKVIGHGWNKMDELVKRIKLAWYLCIMPYTQAWSRRKILSPLDWWLLQKWSFSKSLLACKN